MLRGGIRRGLDDTARTIRLPEGLTMRLRLLSRLGAQFKAQHGREPEPHELGVRPVAWVATLPEPVSLDAPPSHEQGAEPLVANLDGDVPDGEVLALEAEQARAVRGAVATLPPRERAVLTLRFGLDDGGDGRTLDEVAGLLGRTRQRVQQVEALALERLRRRLAGPRLRGGER